MKIKTIINGNPVYETVREHYDLSEELKEAVAGLDGLDVDICYLCIKTASKRAKISGVKPNEKPNVGDIIFGVCGGQKFIYPFGVRDASACFGLYNCEKWVLHTNYVNWLVDSERPATEEEKQIYFDLLAGENLMWDADKCKVVRWRAKVDEKYFYIDSGFECAYHYEAGDSIDDNLYGLGNYFKSEQLAKQAIEKIKLILA